MVGNDSAQVSVLNFWTCYFLDSVTGNISSALPNLVYNCKFEVKYLSGSSHEGKRLGYILCCIIYAIIFFVGTFGFVTNVLNVFLLRRSLQGTTSLKNLLIILAVVDLFACVCVMTNCCIAIVIQDNVNRGHVTMEAFHVFNALYSLGRTAAIYITILVAVERYLVVAFPTKSRSWLSPKKSYVYLLVVFLLTVLFNLSWLINAVVVKNELALLPSNSSSPSSLSEFPFIFNSTSFATDVFPKIRFPLLVMNYVAPFPLLLLFNGLLYFSIYTWSKNRQKLTGRLKKEIGAAKMFSTVVIILLLCHSIGCILFFFSQFMGIVHRELYLLQMLTVTFSAAVNFVVYYAFGQAFRNEVRQLWVVLGIAKQKTGEVAGRSESATDSPSSQH